MNVRWYVAACCMPVSCVFAGEPLLVNSRVSDAWPTARAEDVTDYVDDGCV